MNGIDPLPAQPLSVLLQMASPLLPVGAYAYSQGIERAVHDGWIASADDARRWILDALDGPVAHWDAPVWMRLHRAAAASDAAAFDEWNARFVASRETSELRAETLQMGASLAAWARDLQLGCDALASSAAPSFPAAFAACAVALGVRARDGLVAYAWSWIENQVTAAMKAVPLGQRAGQQLLMAAHAPLERALSIAAELEDDAMVSAAPGLALACAGHEVQYSRLFRS